MVKSYGLLTPDVAEYDPSDHYPPKGTEEACLILSLGNEQFTVLGHTGRYFHGQCACAGYDGEEVGIAEAMDLDHGYWVMEKGRVYGGGGPDMRGEYDDPEVGGEWRRARLSDFKRFNVDAPIDSDAYVPVRHFLFVMVMLAVALGIGGVGWLRPF